ncbi:MAG: sigma-70 family RNA polymerase sigma factor [Clostridia bacterium]|nr:sigma-70 family RNA polymerase sigma factor [Clostridia bacterium]
MLWFFAVHTEEKDEPKAPVKSTLLKSEDLVIKRAVSGDKEAFGELVRAYESMVYNTAMQALRNAEDAYDVSQEVFIKAWRSLGSFRGESKFSTWIYRITCNQIKDYIRAKSRHAAISLSEYDSEEDTEKETDIPDTDRSVMPEEVYLRDELRDTVREAIASMSEDHRQIIVLRDIEGYSYEEIAEMLGLGIGTVKSRINRARNAVKEFLIKRNIFGY